MSVMSRLLDRLGKDQAELEADELARECSRAGCRRIADVRPRALASLTGCVHSVAVPPRGEDPRLDVELYDGTDILQVTWLGRREIGGIVPGVFITVHGRVCEVDGQLTMFNPTYDLLPKRV